VRKPISVLLLFILISTPIISMAAKDPTVTLPGKIEPISLKDNGDGTTTVEFYLTDSGTSVTEQDAGPGGLVAKTHGTVINYLGEFSLEVRAQTGFTDQVAEVTCPSSSPLNIVPDPAELYVIMDKGVTVLSQPAGTLTFNVNRPYIPQFYDPQPGHGSSGFCIGPTHNVWYVEEEVQGSGIYSCVQSGSLVLDQFDDIGSPPENSGLIEFFTSSYVATGSIPPENQQIVTLTYDNGCL